MLCLHFTSSPRTRGNRLLPQSRDVPHPDCLVEAGADHQVLGGVELGAHDVVVVAGQHADALSALPVPDPHSLVITARQDPRILVMKHGGPDVVQMAQQGEDAASLLVVPDFYLVIVSARHKERLLLVEVHSSYRAVVFVKLVKESAHPVVPQLDNSIVKRSKHPGSVCMEGKTLHSRGLGLKLGQHLCHFLTSFVYLIYLFLQNSLT